MLTHRARRVIARRALVLVGAAVLTVPFAASSAYAATSSRATIAGSTPSWATTGRVVGSPSASTRITFNVVLPLRNAAVADTLAAAVSNPKSSSYGHYLTAAQFNNRFAPTTAQVNKVAKFLRSAGITVTGTAQGNRWVTASGTVRQIQSAFGTTLRNYRYKGHVMHAPSTALSVPRSISGLIAGVVGVTNDGALRTPSHAVMSGGSTVDSSASPSDAVPPRQSCSAYWDQFEQVSPPAYGRTSFPTNNCGYTAAQFRGAYDVQSAVNHGDNGSGVTVAIIDAYASATIVSDNNALDAANGEPQLAPGQYTETDFTPFDLQDECGPDGWNEEETLDVAAVHDMAPSANIHYLGAMDCDTGIDDAVNYVLQNHVANLVSNSYGFLGEDGLGDEVATEHSQFTQAAIEGIGFYFSSGDDGDNTIDGAAAPGAGLPGVRPAGHRRRRQRPRGHVLERVPVRDVVGRRPRLGQLRDVAELAQPAAAGQLPLRRRWRGERVVHRAALPEAGGAEQPRQAERVDRDAGRPGRRRGCRPGDRSRDRLPRRAGDNRRHEPGVPAVRGRTGAGKSGPVVPDRLRQPAALHDRADRHRVPRCQGTEQPGRDDDAIRSIVAHPGPGQLADLDQGLRRHNRSRHAERSGFAAPRASAPVTAKPRQLAK